MSGENGNGGLSGTFNSAAAASAQSGATDGTISKGVELGSHEPESHTAAFNKASNIETPSEPTNPSPINAGRNTPPQTSTTFDGTSLTQDFNRAATSGVEQDKGDPPPALSLADGPKPPEYLQRAVMAEARRNAALERLRHRAMEKTREIEYNRNMTINKDRDGPGRG